MNIDLAQAICRSREMVFAEIVFFLRFIDNLKKMYIYFACKTKYLDLKCTPEKLR